MRSASRFGSRIPASTSTSADDGTGRAKFPVWSPDGRRLAFGGDDLWTIAADGSGRPRLVAGGPYLPRDPSWSPDGERILIASEIDQNWFPAVGSYLEIVRADGGGRTRATPRSPRGEPTVVPVARVTPPDRLVVNSVAVRPRVVRPGGTVTARVVIESLGIRSLVDGARVSVSARPVGLRVASSLVSTRGGSATVRIRLGRVPRATRLVRLVFVATKPGDARDAVMPARFVVSMRVRR